MVRRERIALEPLRYGAKNNAWPNNGHCLRGFTYECFRNRLDLISSDTQFFQEISQRRFTFFDIIRFYISNGVS